MAGLCAPHQGIQITNEIKADLDSGLNCCWHITGYPFAGWNSTWKLKFRFIPIQQIQQALVSILEGTVVQRWTFLEGFFIDSSGHVAMRNSTFGG